MNIANRVAATVALALAATLVAPPAFATDADRVVTDATEAAMELVAGAATGVTCVPRSTSVSFYNPTARVYYGSLDSAYLWQAVAETSITGCPTNRVVIRVQAVDQPLDGSSSPVASPEATGNGQGRAGAMAELTQRYSNAALASGFSYHQLTVTVRATQTDGTTTTAWCWAKSWTYLATLAGPHFVGSTGPAKCA